MKNEYMVIDEFLIKGSKVIVLDKKREITDSKELLIRVDNEVVPYKLTHNDNWIIVDTDVVLKGKKIEIID